jgi:dolichyl-phosphate beta-glucosyltransferase
VVVVEPPELTYLTATNPSPQKLPSTVHDPASVDLSVIVPAFNETARMPSMLVPALAHLLAAARTSEIVIVDDGSRDGTAAAALEMARAHAKDAGRRAVEIRVVSLARNQGKGGAVKHGMLHARGRRLLMVDADGASRFEDVEALWAQMDKMLPDDKTGDGEAVVVGSRAHLVKTEAVVKVGGSQTARYWSLTSSQRSPLRNVLMYGLHAVLRVVGVGHIQDTQCGFKLFSRGAAAQIFPRQHLRTWIFDVELLLLAKQLGIPAAEVPINWHEVPGSKLNVVWDSLQMLRDLLVMRGNQLTGRWAVRRDRKKDE